MRHALVTLIASFLGVLVALLAFHLYTRFEADRARAAAEVEMQARLERGAQLAERSLAEERAVLAIRNDVAASSMARMAIAEFYMSTGRMPASNAEVGLPAPETYRGQSLRSMTVAEGGHMLLSFDAYSGVEGGTIEWSPDLTGIESMGIQWHCQTRDFALIARAVPNCEFVPASRAAVTPGR